MMKKILLTFVLLSIAIISLIQDFVAADEGAVYTPPTSNKTEISLDSSSWKFIPSDVPGAEQSTFDDSAWSTINLPHTWNNLDGQDGGNNYYRGVGWYRSHINVSSSHSGKQFYLQFDGANTVTDVWVNGNYLGQHRGGYSKFRFKVSNYINVGGDNVIAVKVNNARDENIAPLSADFTFGGGLYRGVSLVITDNLQLQMTDYASSGVYVKQSNVSDSSADLQITSKVWNNNSSSKNVTLKSYIVDANDIIVKELTTTATVAANTGFTFVQNTTMSNPHLWDGIHDPYLYKAYVEVREGTVVKDIAREPLGIRYFHVDPNQGFFLNGEHYDVHGVSRHQEKADKGFAITNEDMDQDIALIKEMGSTSLRVSHYPQAQHLFDLTDQNGLVVWAEIPLINEITNSTAFSDNAKEQLKEMIRQNYNHPSIIFWGLYNELDATWAEQSADFAAADVLVQQLHDLAKQEDNTRLTTSAAYARTDRSKEFVADVQAFNRYYGWYYGNPADIGAFLDTYHSQNPNRPVGISEYGAGANISQHEQNPAKPTPTGSWHPEEYQNTFHEQAWAQLSTRNFVWAKYIWNMFDFAVDIRNEGNQPGINDKGLVTHDRQVKKDAFYFYKANWSETPTVYITSRRWTERTDPTTEVKIYSNLDSVELKINGVSKGVIQSDGSRIFKWQSVNLYAGTNNIQAIGTKGGVQYTDSTTWTWGLNNITASSSETGNAPINAYDGNVNTRWAASSGTYPQWWKIDLGSAKAVSGMNIKWFGSASRAYKYKIETSADNVNFTTVVDRTSNTAFGDTSDSFLTTARYMRVTVTGSSAGWASANDFEIQFPKTTDSSHEAGNGPDNAIDGDVNTRWSASSGTYPQWWKIDFGSAKAVSGMDIKWFGSASRAYKYKIETSADNVNFTTVVDRTSNTAFGDTSDSFLTTARYMRVTVTGSSAGWASINEVSLR